MSADDFADFDPFDTEFMHNLDKWWAPMSNQQWIAVQVGEFRAVYPDRCGHHRWGYGICAKTVRGDTHKHSGSHSYIPIRPNPTIRQDTDMARLDIARAELADIERQEDDLLKRKEKLLKRVERITARPKNTGEGGVVQFKVQFSNGDPIYKFAAIEVAGLGWYTTSRNHPGPYTWDALLDLVERDIVVQKGGIAEMFVADGWKRLSW